MANLKLEALRPLIEQQIAVNDTDENRDRYKRGDFPRSDKVKDLNKRYRWDLFYISLSQQQRREFMHKAYAIGNDSHIDSLLKSIVQPI